MFTDFKLCLPGRLGLCLPSVIEPAAGVEAGNTTDCQTNTLETFQIDGSVLGTFLLIV